jgi:hypothetical protein
VKKLAMTSVDGSGKITIDVPDGITTHPMREYGGDVYNDNVVDVTYGLFEKEAAGANPDSEPWNNNLNSAARIDHHLFGALFWFETHLIAMLLSHLFVHMYFYFKTM